MLKEKTKQYLILQQYQNVKKIVIALIFKKKVKIKIKKYLYKTGKS